MANKRRRRLLTTFLPVGALFILFVIALGFISGGFDVTLPPTATPERFPGAQSITVEVGENRHGRVPVFSNPVANEDNLVVNLSPGDLLTFYARHNEKDGWYLTAWQRQPAWTYVVNANLRTTLSDLPVVTEEEAAVFFTPAR